MLDELHKITRSHCTWRALDAGVGWAPGGRVANPVLYAFRIAVRVTDLSPR